MFRCPRKRGNFTASAASALTIDNGPATGSIPYFGIPDTQTYGEVFTAPVTGTLNSFTLYLNGGVGALTGNVGTWNGTPSFGYGFGSPATLYTSAVTPSTGAGAYTFTPDVNVLTGQQYVAFLSVYGVPGAAGQTTMQSTSASVPNFDYFVFNNTSSPYGNTSWNYFGNFGPNAQASLTFQAVPGPIPGTGLLSFAVLALGGALTRMRGFLSI